MKTVFEFGGPNIFKIAKNKHMIQVDQSAGDSFIVSYGLQRKTGLDYAQAAKELGECIFHYLVCESIIEDTEQE